MAETASHLFAGREPGSPWVGRSIARVEDEALLSGRGRFIDDSGCVLARSTRRSCARRTPTRISSRSQSAPQGKRAGVVAILSGEDVKALTASLVVGVKAPVECWPIAVGRVRYAGEPVAIVVASRSLSCGRCR